MARKPDDDIDFDFDDFDMDSFGDGGDGGFDDQPKGKPRSPIMQLMGSVSSGIRSNITDPNVQSKYIRESLPVGYQQAFDFAGTTVSTARSLYDNIVKEAKPVIKESKKALRMLMPAVKTVTPKRLGDALEEWSKDDSRIREDMPDPEESEIAMTLGTIFNSQLDAQREMVQETEAKQELRDIAMAKEMRSQGDILQSIEKGIIKQVSYQDQVTAKVQQKSLELQYRQYFATRKSLDIHQQMLELSKASYDSLIKNTALPEAVKIENSELATQLFKQKMFGTVTESMSSWFRGINRRVVSKVKGKTKEFFNDLGSSISDMVMMGEMVNEQLEAQREMGAGGGSVGDMGRDMIGEAAGGGIVHKLASMISKPIRKRLEENGKVASTGLAIKRLFQDLPGFVNDWARSDTSQSGFMGDFIDFFKDAVGSNVRNDKLQTSAVDHLDQKQYWSLQNSKTLNDIIPGWLSRIEANTRSVATKGKDKELMRYNFETTDFERISAIKKKISKKMYNQTDIKSINENAMKIINKIDPPDDAGNYKLPKEARKALLRYVVDLAHNRKQFNMGVLAQDTLPYEIDPQYHDDIREVVRTTFDFDATSRTDDQGRFTNPLGPFRREGGTNQKQLDEISGEFANMQRWFPDMMEKLLREARLGNTVLLKELKLVTQQDDGSFDVNYDDMMKYIDDPSTVPTHARGGLLRRAKGGGTGKVGPRVKNRMANRFKQMKGKVSGPGGKTDDKVPAMLSNGEYVVNSDSVNQPGVLPVLRFIDRLGDVPNGITESGTNDYANADMASVEAAVDDLKATAKSGTELTNEILGEMRDLMKIVAEKPMLGFGVGTGNGKLLEQGKGLFDKLLGYGKKGLSGVKSFNNGVFNTTGAIGKGLFGAGKSLFEMGKNYYEDKKAAVKDIYVNGQSKPVLLARDILEGKYTDKLTNKVITCYDDIKGEVVDKDGNVVLSQSDWGKGLHDRTKSVLTYLTDSVKKVYNTTGQITGAIPTTIKSVFNYGRSILDGATDIYVGDETSPRLKKVVFEAGGYFSAKTGKPITYLSEIDGPIKDKDGMEIIGIADFEKGLVDVNRKPIQGLSNRIKAVLSDATSLPGMVFKFGKDTLDNAVNKAKRLKDAIFDRRKVETTERLDENGNPIMGPFIQEKPSLVTRVMDKFKSGGTAIVDKVKDKVTGGDKPSWLIEITDRMDDVYDLLDWRFNMVVKRMGLANGILEEDNSGPPESRRRLGIKGKLRGLKDKAIEKLGNLKDFIMGKTPRLEALKGLFNKGKEKVGDFLSSAKDKIQGTGMIAGAYLSGKLRSGKEMMGDIIDKVTGKVALSWKQLKEGNYIDKLTGKVTEKWEDIKGDVTDRFGRLVASATDFKEKFMDERGKPLKAKFIEKLSSLKEKAGEMLTKASGMFTLGRVLTMSKLRSARERASDLFVSGLADAKLYWKDLKAGEYFDKLSGKAIEKWKDIKGAVVDKAGKIVLTVEEYLQGLRDDEGKSFGSRMLSKLGRGISSVKQFGKGVLGGIKSGLGYAKDFVGDKLGGAKDWAKDKLKGGMDWFKSLIGKDKEGGEGFQLFGNSKVVDRLDKIYMLLDQRMKKPTSKFGDMDGDGDAENSLQDQRSRNEAAEAEEGKKGWWANMLGKLKGNGKDGDKKGMDITDILSKATGFIKGSVAALTTFFSGGIIGKIVGFVTSGKGMALRGAAMATAAAGGIASAATAVGGAIAAGATAVAGAASLPVIATGVVIAAAGYGAYKLYQHVNRDEKPLFTYRMAQYGYDVDDTDEISAIAALEKECQSILRVDDRGATLTRGKNTGDLMKLFGVDTDDMDEVDNWVTWFKNRFSPVYLKHCHAMYLIKKKTDLSIADTGLTSKEQLSYLAKVNMSDIKPSPYETMNSPFTGWTTSEVNLDADDVQDAYEVAIDTVKDNAEKTDSGKTTQKEVKKSLMDRAKDTLSDLGKSVKDKYQSAVNFTGDAIGKGREYYDKAVAGATKAIEYGAKAYDKAVDYTSKGIEKGAEAAKYVGAMVNKAVKWSQKAPAELFGSIKNAAQRYGIDEGYLLTMAYIESKGDPMAKSSTDCRGIYQFTKGTGKQYGLFAGGVDNRYDMEANVDAGARFARDNYKELYKRLGRPPEPWMLYLAHQQGIGGFSQLMAAAAEGRPVTAKLRKAMDLNGGKGLTAQEFLDKWRNDYMMKSAKITGKSTGPLQTAKPTASPAPTTATQMVDTSKKGDENKPAKSPVEATATAPATTPASTPAPAAVKSDKDYQRSKESFDVAGAKASQQMAVKQVEIKRQDDAAANTKSSELAASILQKQLETQVAMSKGINDIKDILLRLEKAKGSVKETSIRQSDNKARETEILGASQPRPLEKPPVSMSR